MIARFYERHGFFRVFLLFARFSVPYRAGAKAVNVATELRGCAMPRYALKMTNAMVTNAENDEKIIVLNA